jgi:hypothetical protein
MLQSLQKIFGPAFWILGCLVAGAVFLSLGGCASPGGKGVTPPPGYLMQPARRFPKVKGGDDAKVRLAQAAEVHNRNARKIKGLQQYIKTSRKE